jgi:hypothetical protein
MHYAVRNRTAVIQQRFLGDSHQLSPALSHQLGERCHEPLLANYYELLPKIVPENFKIKLLLKTLPKEAVVR